MAFDAMTALANEPLPVFTENDYIRFMLIATERIQDYLQDVRREEFTSDDKLNSAVQRNFSILRDAPADLIKNFSDAPSRFRDVPFATIQARCKALMEPYYQVDPNKLWKCAQEEIPAWRQLLQAASDS